MNKQGKEQLKENTKQFYAEKTNTLMKETLTVMITEGLKTYKKVSKERRNYLCR